MTKQKVIEIACAITGLVFHSMRDYNRASDGFCDKCQALGFSFNHSGDTLRYLRRAVENQLKADGFTPNPRCLRELDELLEEPQHQKPQDRKRSVVVSDNGKGES